ncbi:MAG: glycoside hydrolase family 38 C-terminal domain-containing protein, partial [Limisphaerales bacterium]
NYFDRMGSTMKDWQNRPFWWKGADGHSRVLCWCPSRGYALGHLIGDGEAFARFLPGYLTELETNSYPYDITYLRWNVHGDNGSPDERIADVVRDWNARYIFPHVIISTTAEAFRNFEARYGNALPEYSGDYTPYWEDGAGSSARETGLNRASAERLVQAETLWAMLRPSPFPAADFQETWRNILLYSEHTWGAYNSISQPDLPFVQEQWKVKQGFAIDADQESRELLRRALAAGELNAAAHSTAAAPAKDIAPAHASAVHVSRTVEILNTSSWPRTDLVTLPPELSQAGDLVLDEHGTAVPSQRLSNGDLAVLARDVPAFGSRRYRVRPGSSPARRGAFAKVPRLGSSDFFVRISEQNGAITNLFSRVLSQDLLATNSRVGLNSFFYLPGSDLKGLETSGKPLISVKERGPLVASLLIESSAQGCRSLTREVRVIEGLGRVEIINTIDKLPVREKEGLHFGYDFDVPSGVMRMDVGWAEVRPELDQ